MKTLYIYIKSILLVIIFEKQLVELSLIYKFKINKKII